MSSCFHTPPSNKGKVPVFSFSTGNKYSSFLSFLSFQPDGVSCMHVFSSAQLAGSTMDDAKTALLAAIDRYHRTQTVPAAEDGMVAES